MNRNISMLLSIMEFMFCTCYVTYKCHVRTCNGSVEAILTGLGTKPRIHELFTVPWSLITDFHAF